MQFGLIGKTLKHSVSPQIHECIYQELGLDGVHHYGLLEIEPEKLSETMVELAGQYVGMNVTIPYKIAVMPMMKHISEEAVRIGAINTIKVCDEGLYGYNTDYSGFGRSLQQAGIVPTGHTVAVLGTGGAARAVIQYLLDQRATAIAVVSRKPDQVCREDAFFAQAPLETISYDTLAQRPGTDILVNCTPVGMYPHTGVSPVPEAVAASCQAVVDLIYNPGETTFLQYGRRHGAVTLNGMYMLVSQAVASEEIWLGRSIPSQMVSRIVHKMEALV
jgi:shikimate dehydrogenase